VDRHINFKPGVNYRRGGQRACEHTCGMLSALVYNVSGSNKPEVYKMQKKSMENFGKAPKFRNLGRGIERWCAVTMLLKMAISATKCSTFELQYDKSTLPKTTATRHLGHL